MQLVSSPSPLAGEGRERDRTSQLDPSDKAVGRAQPPHPAFGHPLPKERVSHPSPPGRRCRAAADEGETPMLPTPLTRPSSTLLPPREGAAQRRMRGKRRCFPRPSPCLRPPSPEGEGFHPSPPGRRCRAAADEGETPVLAAPLTRPSATLSPGEGA